MRSLIEKVEQQGAEFDAEGLEGPATCWAQIATLFWPNLRERAGLIVEGDDQTAGSRAAGIVRLRRRSTVNHQADIAIECPLADGMERGRRRSSPCLNAIGPTEIGRVNGPYGGRTSGVYGARNLRTTCLPAVVDRAVRQRQLGACHANGRSHSCNPDDAPAAQRRHGRGVP
jgi:hypothetical protein